MVKNFLTLMLCWMALNANAQTTRTTEIQRDSYGHITGRVETTTHADGTQTVVYKDEYGHTTGTAKSRTSKQGW